MAQISTKKNILYIFTDQLHKFALNWMGTPDIITPNLDQLAEEGTLFTNNYSNCPICTAYRINLCTGLYSSQTKCFRNQTKIPKKSTTIADVFNDNGYHTSFVGKWHVGDNGNGPIPEKLRGGFTDFIGFQCYNGFYKDVNFYDEDNQEHHYDRHRTDVVTDIAIERLKKYNDNQKKKPFFMVLGYQAPHYPVQPSPEYEEMYKDVKIQRRMNIQEIDPYTPTHSPRSPRPFKNCIDYQKYGNDLDEYLRLYYALVTQIDANIGRIITKLKEWGIYESTTIIFSGDHGDMQGSHGLKNKTLPYEESAGVPLIIRDPDLSGGKSCNIPVTVVDHFPTCLDFANIKYPEGLDLPGKSLYNACEGKNLNSHIPAFSEWRSWMMVRINNFKLVIDRKRENPTMFFDLDKDPYEMNNLVDNPDNNEKINELKEEIINWQKYCTSKKHRKYSIFAII